MSLLTRFLNSRRHSIPYSTTLGHRMVSLVQRFPQFKGHLIHYNTTLGHRMVSLVQRCPQFTDHLIHYSITQNGVLITPQFQFLNSAVDNGGFYCNLNFGTLLICVSNCLSTVVRVCH